MDVNVTAKAVKSMETIIVNSHVDIIDKFVLYLKDRTTIFSVENQELIDIITEFKNDIKKTVSKVKKSRKSSPPSIYNMYVSHAIKNLADISDRKQRLTIAAEDWKKSERGSFFSNFSKQYKIENPTKSNVEIYDDLEQMWDNRDSVPLPDFSKVEKPKKSSSDKEATSSTTSTKQAKSSRKKS